jgi:hypothetical protein
MAKIFVERLAYGNLHILLLKNAEKFKDYVNKNKQTFDVAHSYNGCSGAPHYTTMVVAVCHIMLNDCSGAPHYATTIVA